MKGETCHKFVKERKTLFKNFFSFSDNSWEWVEDETLKWMSHHPSVLDKICLCSLNVEELPIIMSFFTFKSDQTGKLQREIDKRCTCLLFCPFRWSVRDTSFSFTFIAFYLLLLSPGVNFINIQHTAFLLVDPKSVKKIDNLTVFFTLLESASVKAVRKTLMKLSPKSYLVFLFIRHSNLSLHEWKKNRKKVIARSSNHILLNFWHWMEYQIRLRRSTKIGFKKLTNKSNKGVFLLSMVSFHTEISRFWRQSYKINLVV